MDYSKLEQLEVRFSGSGGQGLVLASIIFADVMVASGYNVIQGESHGIEARGGASRGEVIASKSEITDLSVKNPDVFVALSQASIDKYSKNLKEESLVLIDSFMIDNVPNIISKNIYEFPFTEIAKEKLKSVLPTNIIFLGTIAELINIVPKDVFREAIKNRIPSDTEKINLEAFDLGVELGKN